MRWIGVIRFNGHALLGALFMAPVYVVAILIAAYVLITGHSKEVTVTSGSSTPGLWLTNVSLSPQVKSWERPTLTGRVLNNGSSELRWVDVRIRVRECVSCVVIDEKSVRLFVDAPAGQARDFNEKFYNFKFGPKHVWEYEIEKYKWR